MTKQEATRLYNRDAQRRRRANPVKKKQDRESALRTYHRDKVKIAVIRKKKYYQRAYGISLEERDFLAQQQNNLCAICRKSARLFVDHNHATGKVRELLCTKCNFGIGIFSEDCEVLMEAIGYLRRHQ